MENEKDIELISGYFAGDEKSLEILIQKYLKPVYRFAYRYVNDAAVADDATQETFLKMWKHLKRYDRKRSFKTWLFSIAKNVALDHLKKKKAIPFSNFDSEDGGNEMFDTLADPDPLPDEIMARADAVYLIQDAIAKLPPAQRLVFILHSENELKFREIAEITGEPLDTVKSRYRRSLFALKKLLSPPGTKIQL